MIRIGFTTTSGTEEPESTCPSEATERALQGTAWADSALREENVGNTQIHIQRARVRLEAAVVEMQSSGK